MQEYTREDYVYLSKLYEKAEMFPEMVKSINKFVELDPKLTKDERNILSAGYKNIISGKRSSWRILNNMERKETEKKNTIQSSNIKEIKDKVEKELNEICDEIQLIIDKYLIPNESDTEVYHYAEYLKELSDKLFKEKGFEEILEKYNNEKENNNMDDKDMITNDNTNNSNNNSNDSNHTGDKLNLNESGLLENGLKEK